MKRDRKRSKEKERKGERLKEIERKGKERKEKKREEKRRKGKERLSRCVSLAVFRQPPMSMAPCPHGIQQRLTSQSETP